VTGNAIVSVAVRAVPSKFSVFNLAAAGGDVASMIVLVEAPVSHRGANAIGARWWAKVEVCRCVYQVRVKGASRFHGECKAG
jgi:hypothetical protein